MICKLGLFSATERAWMASQEIKEPRNGLFHLDANAAFADLFDRTLLTSSR